MECRQTAPSYPQRNQSQHLLYLHRQKPVRDHYRIPDALLNQRLRTILFALPLNFDGKRHWIPSQWKTPHTGVWSTVDPHTWMHRVHERKAAPREVFLDELLHQGLGADSFSLPRFVLAWSTSNLPPYLSFTVFFFQCSSPTNRS
ncbi:MAG: Uncharacterised protein [Flavobacteriales bacterium UBA4585]|nr:MAG: Uncharacterised protein [Flavobacteriales bacterium UBA4585]